MYSRNLKKCMKIVLCFTLLDTGIRNGKKEVEMRVYKEREGG